MPDIFGKQQYPDVFDYILIQFFFYMYSIIVEYKDLFMIDNLKNILFPLCSFDFLLLVTDVNLYLLILFFAIKFCKWEHHMLMVWFLSSGCAVRGEHACRPFRHPWRHTPHRRHPPRRWPDHSHGPQGSVRLSAHSRAQTHGARLPGGDSGETPILHISFSVTASVFFYGWAFLNLISLSLIVPRAGGRRHLRRVEQKTRTRVWGVSGHGNAHVCR